MVALRPRLQTMALAAVAVVAGIVRRDHTVAAAKDTLCSLVPPTYARAKLAHPDAAFAITELEKHSIATWYSDRESNGDYAATARQLVETCPDSSRLSIVVYGLPNKDCEAGYSAGGSRVKTNADYVQFLTTLTGTIGERKVLYVLEPDAVGLLAKAGGCGEAAGYRENLKNAIRILSANANAEIYLDVGYWTLASVDDRARVVAVLQELAHAGGRIRGITLNTSNYRATAEIAKLCGQFQADMGDADLRCIIDTSRNYLGAPSNEWCNVGAAGIGRPPTAATEVESLDYFLWIKPPGESDGQCSGPGHTSDSLRGGPGAGEFFYEAFTRLWDQGYFVQEGGLPKIGARPTDPTPTPTPTTATPTQAPSPTPEPTPVPSVTTSQPTSEPTPIPTVTTPTVPPTTTPTPTPDATSPNQQDVPVETTPTPSSLSPNAPTPGGETTAPVPCSLPPAAVPSPMPTSTDAPKPSTEPVATPPTTTTMPPCPPSPSTSTEPSGHHRHHPKRTRAPLPSTSETPSVAQREVPSSPSLSTLSETTATNPATQVSTTNDGTSSDGGSDGGNAEALVATLAAGTVAIVLALGVFVYVRRRTKEVTAELKTPGTAVGTARPGYLAQL